MAGLWITFMLVFLLTGTSAVVDQNRLATLMQRLRAEYQIPGMFCLALSIRSQDLADPTSIFTANPKATVVHTLNQGDVYRGNRLAVAKVKQLEHAEYRLLQNLQLDSNQGDVLVIYSYASSCPTTCTNRRNQYNIITLIRNFINTGNWGERAFVFERIFKPGGTTEIPESKLATAIRELGNTGIGLQNIFRCFKPRNRAFECTSCSSGEAVAKDCVDYNAK